MICSPPFDYGGFSSPLRGHLREVGTHPIRLSSWTVGHGGPLPRRWARRGSGYTQAILRAVCGFHGLRRRLRGSSFPAEWRKLTATHNSIQLGNMTDEPGTRWGSGRPQRQAVNRSGTSARPGDRRRGSSCRQLRPRISREVRSRFAGRHSLGDRSSERGTFSHS